MFELEFPLLEEIPTLGRLLSATISLLALSSEPETSSVLVLLSLSIFREDVPDMPDPDDEDTSSFGLHPISPLNRTEHVMKQESMRNTLLFVFILTSVLFIQIESLVSGLLTSFFQLID